MKPFSALIKDPRIVERIERIKQETLKHPDIQEFIKQYNVTDEMINKDLDILQEYIGQSHHRCEACPSYKECINFVTGHLPHLNIEDGRIKIHYTICPNKSLHDKEMKIKQYVTAIHVPFDILNATMKDVDLAGAERINIVQSAIEICNKIAKGETVKGMYIYGNFGTGKSYILGAIANQLKEKHVYSTIFYVPEFIRELKSGFNDGTYEKKLDQVRKSQVLMLDDIGSEDLTPWVRDEVLGPLLHYRMMNNLPTFFSSNFDFNELAYHFQNTKNGSEKTKALRMMERIKSLAVPYQLSGKNYRNT